MDKYKTSALTFNKFAEQYQEKYGDYGPYVETYERFFELITRDNPKIEMDILDVACGPGNIAKHLLSKKPDFNIHGVDLAPRMVELARANCPTATFEIMDSRHIDQIKKRFDVIIAGFCFPYLSKLDIAKFLSDARKLLRSNGLLYISTMEDVDERSGFNQAQSGDQIYIHYHQFEYLHHHLEQNGFQIITTLRKAFPTEEKESIPTTDLFIFAQLK